MREGLYGDIAWRGWQITLQLRTHPAVVHLLQGLQEVVEHSNRLAERCADEIHDSSEQAFGIITLSAHRTRRRFTAAAVSTAHALRRTG